MSRLNGLKTMPLEAAAKGIRLERSEALDLYLPLSKVAVEVRDPMGPLHSRYHVSLDETGCPRPLRLTETGLMQLARAADMPMRFLERAPAAMGLNALRSMLRIRAEKNARSFLFRVRAPKDGPVLRAILPSSFVRLDDALVLDELRDVTGTRTLRVSSVLVNEDLMEIRLLFPEELSLQPFGGRSKDPSFPGIDIRTSETGRYPFEVREVLLRVVCQNGMTRVTEMDATRVRQNGRMNCERLRATVHQAMEQAVTTGGLMAKRLAGWRLEYVGDPGAEVARILERYRLGSTHGRAARWVRQELSPQMTLLGVRRFDVVQAFTAVARRLDHVGRVRFEDAMGDYVMRN